MDRALKYIFITILFIGSVAQAQSLEGYAFNVGQKESHPFQTVLEKFTTDGCSRYSDGTKENPTLWQHCCINHDAKYWLGGTKEERKQADDELYECVKATGNESDAKIMYSGTRAGGGPLRYTTYRWGYGWNRIRDYAPISDIEMEMAEALYGKDLEELTKSIKDNKYIVSVPENYSFQSPFQYSYCDEQIINYLSPKLMKSARVIQAQDYQISSTYHIRIRLDICEDFLDFTFSKRTSSQSCKKDYAYSNHTNNIAEVEISKKCLARMSEYFN